MKQKPVCLVILDGFGYNAQTRDNAIAQARTPTLDYFMHHYPHTTLYAAGKYVGLLHGMMGNSEVGHITIGAGRIVDQPIKIMNAQLYEKLSDLFQVQDIQRLHIMGLLSDAGVHSSMQHFFDAINAALASDVHEIYIHVFLDGRDEPPQSAQKYLQQLDEYTQEYTHVTLATVHGRFYAMDRDSNWDRTEKSFSVLAEKQVNIFSSWREVLEKNYAQNVTDEFIEPVQLDPKGIIKKNDTVLFLNFRPDRARQITELLLQGNSVTQDQFITPVSYGNGLATTVLFKTAPLTNTLKEELSRAGKRVLSIAETEKYAHVTYFLGGGYEDPFPGETQILIPSLGAKNYAVHPEMSAEKITDTVLASMQKDEFDVYLINYANADMVGHSGDMQATVQAVECLDLQLKQLYDLCVVKKNGIIMITADHGNAEDMWDEVHNQPRTSHTSNDVPFIFVTQNMNHKKEDLRLKGLSDIKHFVMVQVLNEE